MEGLDRLLVQEIVQGTIKELKKSGALKSVAAMAYADATEMMRKYYRGGEADTAVKTAMESIADDPYFKILPLSFRYGYTLEDIAEVFEVEISTISRNKKRLCLEVYGQVD